MDKRYCQVCGTLQEPGEAYITLTRDSLKDTVVTCGALVYYCPKCNMWEDHFDYIYDIDEDEYIDEIYN